MTAALATDIVDDDGVAVIGSRAALHRRYADGDFDYEFPNALVEGMRLTELFAWRTGSEGSHHVVVEVVSDAVFDAAGGVASTPVGALVIEERDALLVLPYSQFTYECDHRAEFDLRDGLGASVQLPPARYRVRVERVAAHLDGCSFRVVLCANDATTPNAPVDAVPGWDE